MISLTYGGDTLVLHPDLHWADEFDWHPVEQAVTRSLTGALIVEYRQRLLGRPITLVPFDDRAAWMPRETAVTLREWAAVPGRQMTLNLRGTQYVVMWRHQDDPALSARPVIDYSDPDASDFLLAELKFMVVA